MSKTSVTNAVLAICREIQDVRVAELGYPEPLEGLHGSLPYVAVKVGRCSWQQFTAGPGGGVSSDYVIKMRLYLANFDMVDHDIEMLALPFDDRFRAAFYADRQLTSTCFVSELSTSFDNLETYKDRPTFEPSDAYAYMDYMLAVTEHAAANSPAVNS